VEPVNKRLRDLLAEKEVFVAEREALQALCLDFHSMLDYVPSILFFNQAESRRWRERVDAVLSKYNQVDPEVHKQLQQTHEATLQELSAARAAEVPLFLLNSLSIV
jgi:hypothetical protein